MLEALFLHQHKREVGYLYIDRQPIPIPIYSQMMAGFDKYIYLYGGRRSDGNFSKQLFRYDTELDIWTEKAQGITDCYQAGSCFHNGKFYIHGGSNSNGNLGAFSQYDIATDTWASLPATSVRDWPSLFVDGDYLYSFFGIVNTTPQNELRRFHLVTRQWEVFTSPTVPSGRCYINPVKLGSKVYFIGGRDTTNTYGSQVWVYDIPTNSFTQLADLPRGQQASFIWLVDNKIYVTGGFSSTGNFDELYAYDIAKNIWKKEGANPHAIIGSQGASIGRRAFFGGGRPGSQPSSAINNFREII